MTELKKKCLNVRTQTKLGSKFIQKMKIMPLDSNKKVKEKLKKLQPMLNISNLLMFILPPPHRYSPSIQLKKYSNLLPNSLSIKNNVYTETDSKY